MRNSKRPTKTMHVEASTALVALPRSAKQTKPSPLLARVTLSLSTLIPVQRNKKTVAQQHLHELIRRSAHFRIAVAVLLEQSKSRDIRKSSHTLIGLSAANQTNGCPCSGSDKSTDFALSQRPQELASDAFLLPPWAAPQHRQISFCRKGRTLHDLHCLNAVLCF